MMDRSATFSQVSSISSLLLRQGRLRWADDNANQEPFFLFLSLGIRIEMTSHWSLDESEKKMSTSSLPRLSFNWKLLLLLLDRFLMDVSICRSKCVLLLRWITENQSVHSTSERKLIKNSARCRRSYSMNAFSKSFPSHFPTFVVHYRETYETGCCRSPATAERLIQRTHTHTFLIYVLRMFGHKREREKRKRQKTC